MENIVARVIEIGTREKGQTARRGMDQ